MNEDLDQQVLLYLQEERDAGRPVSNEALMEKARALARGVEGVEGVDPEFKASAGWLKRWKKRNNVGIRRGTNEAQKLPEDYGVVVKDFVNGVHRKRVTHDYANCHIGNMDQTMARFDMAPNYTNNVRGERDVRIATAGGAKRGFTVALTATADGNKRPAYVVLKEPSGKIPPRVLQNLQIPRNIRLVATRNGWMTGTNIQDWVARIWGPNTDDARRLLILDQARIHTMQTTKDLIATLDTDLMFVPAGCTSIVQPADVSWNKPFKQAMRREWIVWRQMERRTAAGNLQVIIYSLYTSSDKNKLVI